LPLPGVELPPRLPPGLDGRGVVAVRAESHDLAGGADRLRLQTHEELDRGSIGPGGQEVRLRLDGLPVDVEHLVAPPQMEIAVGEIVERRRVARLEEQRVLDARQRFRVPLLAE
jgi:hypothetical protein